jgi:hypothetical protein
MHNAFNIAKYIVEHPNDNNRILEKLNNLLMFTTDRMTNSNSRRYLTDMIEAININSELVENEDYNYLKEYITAWLERITPLQEDVQNKFATTSAHLYRDAKPPPLIPYGESFISLKGGKRCKHTKRRKSKKRRTRRK